MLALLPAIPLAVWYALAAAGLLSTVGGSVLKWRQGTSEAALAKAQLQAQADALKAKGTADEKATKAAEKAQRDAMLQAMILKGIDQQSASGERRANRDVQMMAILSGALQNVGEAATSKTNPLPAPPGSFMDLMR